MDESKSLVMHFSPYFNNSMSFSMIIPGFGLETSSSCSDWPKVGVRAATAPQLLLLVVPTSNDALEEGSLLEFQRTSEVLDRNRSV